jgi:hypothetical protein
MPPIAELMPSPPAPKPWALWFRTDRREKWVRLHTAGTERDCTKAMFSFQETTKTGDWYVGTKDPNARPRR